MGTETEAVSGRTIVAKIIYPDFFNDVFGPIMQPGSSGGFAGPIRIGAIARALVLGDVSKAVIKLPSDYGDLSKLDTFMTDRGFVGGLLGFDTADDRLFAALELAEGRGLEFDFEWDVPGGMAGNDVLIEVSGPCGRQGRIIARSIGGGMVDVVSVNGFVLGWKADTFAFIVFGSRLEVSHVAAKLAKASKGSLVTSRHLPFAKDHADDDAQAAFLLELPSAPDQSLLEIVSGLGRVVLPAQLPVVTSNGRRAQLFATVPEWEAYARGKGISLSEAAIHYEQAFSGWDRDEVWDRFELIASILDRQIHALDQLGPSNVEETPVLPIYGRQWERYAAIDAPEVPETVGCGEHSPSEGRDPASPEKPSVGSFERNASDEAMHRRGRPGGGSLNDGLIARIIPYALSTNAKIPGVVIVPGPMGTGGGYLFSALKAVQEHYGMDHRRLIESLIVAAALGAIAFTHTNASGERGCVGESGVCCAMASGAIAYLAGGDAVEVDRAASMAIQGSIGITCDPIPGGKEFPCLTRTVRAATTAPLYADLALSGIDPIIPYHEMLQAVEKHYRDTPENMLHGTECGCNCTPSALSCMNWLSGAVAQSRGR